MVNLKIKRTKEAKEFPLLHIKKEGDVGLDIPACLPKLNDDQIENTISYHNHNGIIDDYTMDTISHESVTIFPGQRGVIATGIFLEIPIGYWASIEARSSTSKRLLIVPKGVIDEGYRGELMAVLINVGTERQIIYHGDRMVQLILHKKHIDEFTIEEVDELSESERGESGFGSTGVFEVCVDRG